MPETPMGSTADGARPEVARLAELFRRSFAALDAEARAAGRRWAGEIDRELARIGSVELRADTAKALSDIRSLDNELNRDRTLRVGADLHADPGPGDMPGAGGGGGGLAGGGLAPIADAISAASGAAGALAAAVGGVVGVVSALGASAGQPRDSARTTGISAPAAITGAAPSMGSMGSILTPEGVADTGSPGLSAAPTGASGGAAASPVSGALSGLGALLEGLSSIGGGGVPGDVTVAPPNQPSGSGLQAITGSGGGSGLPQMPPAADAGSMPAGPGGGSGVSGLADALKGISALTGGLPTGDIGGAMPNLSSPTSPAGVTSALNSPTGLASPGFPGGGAAVGNPGMGAPGVNSPGVPGGGYGSPGVPGAGYGSPGVAPSAAGGGGAGGQRSDAGVLNLPGAGGDGLGPGGAGGVAGGRAVLTSGRIAMGGDAAGQGAVPGSPAGDPMASAPTGPVDMSAPVMPGVAGNPLVLGSLYSGLAGATTNNQSSATFNISGGNQPGVDAFMSFWRDFGRIGGLIGSVGSFLQ